MLQICMIRPGLCEQLIDCTLRQELDTIPPERKSIMPVDPARTAEALSRDIAEGTKKALSGMAEGRDDVADQMAPAKLPNVCIKISYDTQRSRLHPRPVCSSGKKIHKCAQM